MKILHVAGARPNFMKVAPVLRALAARGASNVLVHTGQHYDHKMSQSFFDDLGLPDPDYHLEVGSGTHAVQTAKIMQAFEPVVLAEQPDLTLVVGDVNSTIATGLVCAKLGLRLGHVEAGLRSFDRDMPEEINRVLTDQISDILFTTVPEAEDNLLREGIDAQRIHFVGNPMIDSLLAHRERSASSAILEDLNLTARNYVLVTMHRASNTDSPDTLRGVLEALADVAKSSPVLFPVHPRTAKMIHEFGLTHLIGDDRVRLVEPVGYVDFLKLMDEASLVLTDSGGIQEETTVLGVPCLTMRWNTERPVTCTMGTNTLIGTEPDAIRKHALEALQAGRPASPKVPPLWDGNAGERIAEVLMSNG